MKKEYKRVEFSVTEFETEDVLTSSSIIQDEDDMEVLPYDLEY